MEDKKLEKLSDGLIVGGCLLITTAFGLVLGLAAAILSAGVLSVTLGFLIGGNRR